MRLEATANVALQESERALIMEQVILTVRRLWFRAHAEETGYATRVVEAGGEMLMLVDGDRVGAGAVVAEATGRGSYVVVTDYTRPKDLAAHLRLAGFRRIQKQATYIWDPPPGWAPPEPPVRQETRGFLSRLFGREVHVAVTQIGEAELPVWNSVCWRAFEGRSSEAFSLAEKRQAFQSMGSAARWYLATVNGAPAGTAMLYQAEEAAQVLAVGTLPTMRRRGVAAALMRRLMEDWQQEGWGFLFLDTTPGSAAERIYLRLGFRPAYTRETYLALKPPFLTEG